MSNFIYCRLYGVQHRLNVEGIDFSQQTVSYMVSASDMLRMMPRIQVGAAYDTYTPYNVLKAGRADFKIKKIEKISADEWRYSFVDYADTPFNTILKRRSYVDRTSESSRLKRQST
ncbi:hypothetical protein pEaSNUABM28_00263 [Erwinia phage pEa_SNUABM_28]|nr:hypothetical protein pEaSNUABM28_00263 [Erwinia phage pEa_SNUABM_28]QZE59164.1 hypothetical protein pEaSNUABM18_00261 [Erwinia phage pEa_SNUABM_18]